MTFETIFDIKETNIIFGSPRKKNYMNERKGTKFFGKFKAYRRGLRRLFYSYKFKTKR